LLHSKHFLGCSFGEGELDEDAEVGEAVFVEVDVIVLGRLTFNPSKVSAIEFVEYCEDELHGRYFITGKKGISSDFPESAREVS
jgi:hypothetical protein